MFCDLIRTMNLRYTSTHKLIGEQTISPGFSVVMKSFSGGDKPRPYMAQPRKR